MDDITHLKIYAFV